MPYIDTYESASCTQLNYTVVVPLTMTLAYLMHRRKQTRQETEKWLNNCHSAMLPINNKHIVKLLINASGVYKTRASEPLASIRDRHLFETQRLLEVLRYFTR